MKAILLDGNTEDGFYDVSRVEVSFAPRELLRAVPVGLVAREKAAALGAFPDILDEEVHSYQFGWIGGRGHAIYHRERPRPF